MEQLIILPLLQLALFALLTAPAPPPSRSVPPAIAAPAQDVPKATATANPDEADSLVLPDGTPIRIKVVNGFSSENAKVGDVINFAVAFDVHEGGLVVIPQRTGLTGKVVFVSRPHRGARSGRVNVAFDALTLPTGETATVRSIKKPPSKAAKVEEGATTAVGTAAELFITAGVPLLILFKKGDEQVVPEGVLEKVYLNGPLRLSRKAVMALQPTAAPIAYRRTRRKKKRTRYPTRITGWRHIDEAWRATARILASFKPEVRLAQKPSRITACKLSVFFACSSQAGCPERSDLGKWIPRKIKPASKPTIEAGIAEPEGVGA